MAADAIRGTELGLVLPLTQAEVTARLCGFGKVPVPGGGS